MSSNCVVASVTVAVNPGGALRCAQEPASPRVELYLVVSIPGDPRGLRVLYCLDAVMG